MASMESLLSVPPCIQPPMAHAPKEIAESRILFDLIVYIPFFTRFHVRAYQKTDEADRKDLHGKSPANNPS